jgi:hypothetical protein
MTDANKAKKRRQQAYAFSIEDKVWLIDLAEQTPALGSVDLGRRLADHVNEGRAPAEVRSWLWPTHHPSTPSATGRGRRTNFAVSLHTRVPVVRDYYLVAFSSVYYLVLCVFTITRSLGGSLSCHLSFLYPTAAEYSGLQHTLLPLNIQGYSIPYCR